MAQVLVVAAEKGGVGKTTSAVNIAAAWARQGKRVLLVDMDHQGTATLHLGLGLDGSQLANAMCEGNQALEVLESNSGVYVVSGGTALGVLETRMASLRGRERRLGLALEPLRKDYDFIVIDSPPSLGTVTVNALYAADYALIPVECEAAALFGLVQVLETISALKAELGRAPAVLGLLPTKLDARTRLGIEVAEHIKTKYPKLALKPIDRAVSIAEAVGAGQPIFDYDPQGKGAAQYGQLAAVLLERMFKED